MNTRYSAFVLAGMLYMGFSSFAAETINYTYDDAGRLTRADYGDGARIDYVYDANGNLLQRTVTADGTVTYTLIYLAGTGGRIDGVATQVVAAGESGTAVTAVPEDAGAVFGLWSDGRADQTRTDTNVTADLTVNARFQSEGGADINWYNARGITPAGDETWADVDARAVPAKGTTLRHENIADTNPDDPDDTFRILSIEPGPPPVVIFRPGSTGRVYRLVGRMDLVDGPWTNVPGAGPRPGGGEATDTLSDTNAPLKGPFYHVVVELP